MKLNLQKLKSNAINILIIISPLWLPLLVSNIAAYFGCCAKNDSDEVLFIFGVLPGVISFFVGFAKICELAGKDTVSLVVFLITYVLISVILLTGVMWMSLLILGVSP